ncbi:zf-TFIIB domain-containing protein [Pleionea sp. CnH1-48]|uniref:zf-TFIIB domain-containing protein n=1 Tax=Pleionea sp. CnH1-48 TaxID=2954494 RepID=UPI0020980A47|nr:zf-TFIIB domain-containing protein [Pleionea sp. CnH1-48]MCO7225231.1 zf-TFIIB domain-containing protein [Pleionea sp. CnH1-48]
MQCPSCVESYLRPVKLTDSFPAYHCLACEGYLIDILNYRMWRDSNPQSVEAKSSIKVIEDTSNAVHCPRCDKFMAKYRISHETDNRLDVCNHCSSIWFDGGEWHILAKLGLEDKIPEIISEPWQVNIKKTIAQQSIDGKFQQLLGDDFNKTKDFAEWIKQHPKQDVVFDYLLRVKNKL